jgi:hypothetical protein
LSSYVWLIAALSCQNQGNYFGVPS